MQPLERVGLSLPIPIIDETTKDRNVSDQTAAPPLERNGRIISPQEYSASAGPVEHRYPTLLPGTGVSNKFGILGRIVGFESNNGQDRVRIQFPSMQSPYYSVITLDPENPESLGKNFKIVPPDEEGKYTQDGYVAYRTMTEAYSASQKRSVKPS